MKIFKTLTFAALAALAVALFFQTTITRAGDHGQRGDNNERGDRDHRDAKATFTKWITAFPNQPGLIATMAGVVGGNVGEGLFTGEVLKMSTDNVTGVTEIVAFYHFNGPNHSFTALVHVEQTGLKAVIIGVVTDGWLKGHAVEGEYTQITLVHDGITSDAYQGTLEIQGDSNH
jgi:hypothetical protein